MLQIPKARQKETVINTFMIFSGKEMALSYPKKRYQPTPPRKEMIIAANNAHKYALISNNV
jgi:hypothetical protein